MIYNITGHEGTRYQEDGPTTSKHRATMTPLIEVMVEDDLHIL